MAIWNGTMPLREPFIQLAPGQYHHPSIEINLEIISIIKCIECPPFQYESDLVELIVSPTKPFVLISTYPHSLSLSNVLIRSFGELISAPIFDIVEGGLYLSGVTVSSLQSMAPVIMVSGQATIEVNTCTFENITLKHNLTGFAVQPAVIDTGSQAQLFVTSTDFISNTLHVIEGSYGGVAIRSQGCYQIIDSRFINSSIIAEPHSNLNRTSLGGALLLSSQGIITCASPNLINRTEFTNNTIDSRSDMIAGTGAAIAFGYFTSIATNYIDFCTFNNNKASYGGAIGLIFQQFSASTSVVVQNSCFQGNVAYRAGGAIHLWRAIDWTIERCNFTQNILFISQSTESFGGAAIALTQLLPTSIRYPLPPPEPTLSTQRNGSQHGPSQFQEADQSTRLILRNSIFENNSLLQAGGTIASIVLTVLTTDIFLIDSCQFLNHQSQLLASIFPLIRLNQIAHAVITRSQFIDNLYPVLVASNIKTTQTSTQIMPTHAMSNNSNVSQLRLNLDSDSAPSSAPSHKKSPFPIKSTDFLYEKSRLENPELTICSSSAPTIPFESVVNLVISNNLFFQDYKTNAGAELDLSLFGSALFQSNNFTCTNMSSTTSQPLQPLINLDGSMSDAYFVDNFFKSTLIDREAIRAIGMDEVIISNSRFENAIRFDWSSKIIVDSSNFSVTVGPAISLSFCKESCISRSTFTGCLSSFSGSAISSTGTETEVYASNFHSNQVLYRGAIYSDIELRVFNSSFNDNRAGASGGAIWAGGRLLLFGSHFEANYADTGAAVVAADQLIILDCKFFKNIAFQQGGALWLGFGAEAVIVGTHFEDNSATYLGGAVYLGARSALYANSTRFIGNYVNDESNDADESEFLNPQSAASIVTEGAGGSISAAQAEVLVIEYCSFFVNRAHYGADVHMQMLPRVFVIYWSDFSNPRCHGSGASIALQPSLASSFLDSSQRNSSQTTIYGLCKPWPLDYDWRIQSSKFGYSYLNQGYGGFILWIPCSNSSLHPAPVIDITDTEFDVSSVRRGGVILAAGPPHQFIRWSNITFYRNTAIDGGDVLFYNMVGSGPIKDPLATIQSVCTQEEGCVHSSITSSLATSTGYRLNLTDPDDIQATPAEINARQVEHSFSAATGSVTPVWTADFRRIIFNSVDLYNQTNAEDTKPSLNISMLTGDGSSISPLFSFWTDESQSLSWTRIDFNVSVSLYRLSKLWSSKDRFENLFDQFYPVQLLYEIPPTDPQYNRFWIPKERFRFRIGACKIGSGLQKNPLFPDTYGCRECPFGTYNLNGDGQCYLCNDPSTTEEKLYCELGGVKSHQGWFFMRDSRDDIQTPLASHMPSKGKSNRLWVYPCNPHYCGGRYTSMGCDSHLNRTGLLCAHCSPGSSPSITSAKCSVCKGTWHSFGVLSLAILVATTTFMHVGLQRHFATTFFSFTFISISIMFPHQWLTENLPYAFYGFDWYCLGSSTPLNRAAIAAPVISAFSLPLSFVFVVLGVLLFHIIRYAWHKTMKKLPGHSLLNGSPDIVDAEDEEGENVLQESAEQSLTNKIAKGENTPLLSAKSSVVSSTTSSTKAERKRSSRYAPNITTWGAVLITTWLLIGLSLTPILQTIIEFWAYIDSPLDDLWSVAPAVKITDHEFLAKRKLWMGLGIPYFITALSFFFGMFLKPFKAFEILLLKEFETLKTAKIWIGLTMLLHLLTGILVSLAYWNLKTETVVLPLVLLAFSCSFATFHRIREGHMAGFNVFGSFVLACFALLPLLNHAPSIGSQLQWDITHFALTIFVWLIVMVGVLAPMSCLKKLRIA